MPAANRLREPAIVVIEKHIKRSSIPPTIPIIARATGFNRATVAAIVKTLVAAGKVVPGGASENVTMKGKTVTYRHISKVPNGDEQARSA